MKTIEQVIELYIGEKVSCLKEENKGWKTIIRANSPTSTKYACGVVSQGSTKLLKIIDRSTDAIYTHKMNDIMKPHPLPVSGEVSNTLTEFNNVFNHYKQLSDPAPYIQALNGYTNKSNFIRQNGSEILAGYTNFKKPEIVLGIKRYPSKKSFKGSEHKGNF